MYLALPNRLVSDKNEVINSAILKGTTSDGMNTDNAPKILSKRLGTYVCQTNPCNLLFITIEYLIADLFAIDE